MEVQDSSLEMGDDSIIGRYARIAVDEGSTPLLDGLKLACRITGLATEDAAQRKPALRGQIVSNDVDGPLDRDLVEGSLIISPTDPDISEAILLQGGSFRTNLSLLSDDGAVIARGHGALLRLSEDVPFEGVCPNCQGWKICEDCAGTGGGPKAACGFCGGTGHCARCGGSGSVTESG